MTKIKFSDIPSSKKRRLSTKMLEKNKLLMKNEAMALKKGTLLNEDSMMNQLMKKMIENRKKSLKG
jgi:hypothetical protein